MAKKTIDIDLQGDDVVISLGALFPSGAPHDAPDLIPDGKHRGPHWSVDLEPGDYRFSCGLRAPAGACGPVVVKDGNAVLKSQSGTCDGLPGTIGTAMLHVPFTVN
jgi:hypothetical protein